MQNEVSKNLVNFSFSTVRKQNKERLEKSKEEVEIRRGFLEKALLPQVPWPRERSFNKTLGDLKINLLELGCHRRLVFDSSLRKPEEGYRTSWWAPLMAEWNGWWLHWDWCALQEFLVVRMQVFHGPLGRDSMRDVLNSIQEGHLRRGDHSRKKVEMYHDKPRAEGLD